MQKPKDIAIMMNELIETLRTEQYALVILHEGNISTFEGRGVRTLYNILEERPELLLGAKAAIKAARPTDPKTMLEGGVREVWAEVLSERAYNMLTGAGIKVAYEKRVDHATFLKLWEKMGEVA